MEVLQLEMMPVSQEITRVDNAIERFLIEAGFTPYKDVRFAVHELLINSVQAMNQKYAGACPYLITIAAKANPDIAEVCITDYGGGLPEGLSEYLEDIAFEDILLQESGRGLLIVKCLTDFFECSLSLDGAASYKIIKRRDNNGKVY